MKRILFLATVLGSIAATAIAIDQQSMRIGPPTSSSLGASLPERIVAPGVVEGATEAITLQPEEPGRVLALLVSVGDWVEPNQPLVQLDDRRQRLELSAAKSQLALARAQLARLLNGARQQERDEARALKRAAEARLSQATTSLRRIEQLERQNAIAAQDADDARSRVETLRAELAATESRLQNIEAPAREDEVQLAEARVAAAEAAVGLAEVAVNKTVIRAPSTAQVLDINAEAGEFLTPGVSSSTIVLVDTSRLRVRAFVEELDAPRVMLGGAAEIIADGLPGRVIEGRVQSLSPQMTAKRFFSGQPNELYDTKVREVLLDVQDAEGLIIGLRVDVQLSAETSS